MDIYVVDEKLYKAYLKQGEFPHMSPLSFSEKVQDNSVFANSEHDQNQETSSEKLTKIEKTEKMFDFESAPTLTPGHNAFENRDGIYSKVNYKVKINKKK